jgi:hypothetical protein
MFSPSTFYKFPVEFHNSTINSLSKTKVMRIMLCLVILIFMEKGTNSIRIVHGGSRNHVQWSHERLLERHNDHFSSAHLSLVKTSNKHFIFSKANEHLGINLNS